jgi:hypothetical protein
MIGTRVEPDNRIALSLNEKKIGSVLIESSQIAATARVKI